MSEQNTIAIICDCDGTLCPDTTELLVSRIGGKPRNFWYDVYKEVQEDWEKSLGINSLIEK